MKYTSDYINSISYKEYLELMAKELNEHGFKESGKYDYYVDSDPKFMKLFMMGPVNDPKALAFLKEIGLLENGRCPECGAPMSVYRYTWSDRRDPAKKYYVCYGCSISNGHGDGHSMDGYKSGAPSSSAGQGCLLSFALLPFFILKLLFTNFIH